MTPIQKLLLTAYLLCAVWQSHAQQTWPAPEVEQMYRNASGDVAAGNYTDAIIIYKQAIALAPGKMLLYRGLGNALFLSGAYTEAKDVLSPVVEKNDGDTLCYSLLAQVQAALYDYKQAVATLHKGLKRFPNAGGLYHELGIVYAKENNREDALAAWLDGIQKDPVFALNYYDASLLYLGSRRPLWGLLYAEQYLAMTSDTTDDLRQKLFTGYKTFFDDLAGEGMPVYGRAKEQPPAADFEDAVQQVYHMLTPVISDGVTTENLTMIRVRFLMEWYARYAQKYPYTLFSYQDKLLRNGRFDIYNEWLFGKAESAAEYKAWNTFHEGDIGRFEQWCTENRYVPAAKDFYNSRDMHGLFRKK